MKSHFNNIANEISQCLDSSNHKITIAVAWFTNEDLFSKICDKVKSGVEVELLIIDDIINNNSFGLNLQDFINLGGKLYFGNPDNLMHHKFCIIDSKILINGSYNWTYFAEYKNLENIIICNDLDTVNSFKSEFLKIARELPLIENVIRNTNFDSLKYEVSTKAALTDDFSLKSFKYETNGNYKKAIQIAKRAMELFPSDLNIKKQLSNLETKENNITRAGYIPLAPTINSPKFNNFNFALKEGIKAYKKKNYLHAIQYFREAISQNSEFAELYFWIGLSHWKLNNIDDVIDNCDKSIMTNSSFAVAYNLRGIAFNEKGNYNKAISDFEKAIQHQPNLFKAHFNVGLVYKKKGDSINSTKAFNKSIEYLNILLLKNPFDEEALAIRGDIYSIVNRIQEAKIDYQKAREIYDSKTADEKDLNYEERIKNGFSR